MTDARIFAVAGAKGGVGKTTTSINLGTSFALRGAETVVVELDLAMANVVDFLDLPVDLDEVPTMHDVLAGSCEVTAATYGAPGEFDVVPSGTGLDGFAEADVSRLSSVLSTLTEEYERIVLDTGAGLSKETVVPIGKADEVVVVATPRVAAVRDAEKTKRLAERLDTEIAGVVFTKSGTGNAPPPPELAAFLDLDLLGHVPEDSAVPASQDEGEPVVTNAPSSRAAEAYSEVAVELDRRTAVEASRERAVVTGTVEPESDADRQRSLDEVAAAGADTAAGENQDTARTTSPATPAGTADSDGVTSSRKSGGDHTASAPTSGPEADDRAPNESETALASSGRPNSPDSGLSSEDDTADDTDAADDTDSDGSSGSTSERSLFQRARSLLDRSS